MKYIRKRPPPIVIFENVSKILATRKADGGKPPPVIQQDSLFTNLGYSGTWFELNSKDYGLAQSRPRVYMVYFHASGGCLKELDKFIMKFRVAAKPLDHYILKEAQQVEPGSRDRRPAFATSEGLRTANSRQGFGSQSCPNPD